MFCFATSLNSVVPPQKHHSAHAEKGNDIMAWPIYGLSSMPIGKNLTVGTHIDSGLLMDSASDSSWLQYSLYFVLISWCLCCLFVCIWFPHLALIFCHSCHLYPLCKTNASGLYLYSDPYSFNVWLNPSHLLSRLMLNAPVTLWNIL